MEEEQKGLFGDDAAAAKAAEVAGDAPTPKTVKHPYAFYDEDDPETLYSWLPGEPVDPDDVAHLLERGVELVDHVPEEG